MDAPALLWATLFGLMFMTMGPIGAIAVFSAFGESDHAPGVRPLAARSIGRVAAAFAVAALLGDLVLVRWGVDLPALVIAAGAIVFALSLQAMLSPPAPAAAAIDATRVPAASLALAHCAGAPASRPATDDGGVHLQTGKRIGLAKPELFGFPRPGRTACQVREPGLRRPPSSRQAARAGAGACSVSASSMRCGPKPLNRVQVAVP
jgi:hypothetical protein